MQVKTRAALGQLSDMDIRLLRVFKSVAECGGMAAAELELNIGTSTVSRHIKDLETRLVTCMATLQGFNAAEIYKTPFGKGEQNNVTALATWISAESKGMRFNLSQAHPQEKTFYEVGKRLFFQRGGPHDFSCASCHGEEGKRIRLQDLPMLTKNPGDGVGFAAWPAYRVSNGQMWGMQLRLNDCYRQQRFPYPGFGSDATLALATYLGVNAKGAASVAPAIKR